MKLRGKPIEEVKVASSKSNTPGNFSGSLSTLLSESRKPQPRTVLIYDSPWLFHCCLHKPERKIKTTRPTGPVWKPRQTSEFPASCSGEAPARLLLTVAAGMTARVVCGQHTDTEQATHDVPGHTCPHTRGAFCSVAEMSERDRHGMLSAFYEQE